ncbi:hypothetical protein J3U35_06520 [Gilliamella sp. B2717]|uniref:hypothetical protein n=1 Tax=Gilliamella sp. B2717 TaxID=2817996 RepID=UPI00226A162F|nr:hypothetical protein [Gilliamella sp. B2717]MCX8579093.1 hypothetical protein [Gilliamella sp. B2717]
MLEQYKAFLEGDYNDPNNPPDPIDVEFIAEGQEAIDIYIWIAKFSSGSLRLLKNIPPNPWEVFLMFLNLHACLIINLL